MLGIEEIRPSSTSAACSNVLEFEDGTEVYDTAAYSLDKVHPDIIVDYTNEAMNTYQA